VETLVGLFKPLVGAVEGDQRGFELGVPQGALDEPGMHAGGKERGSVRMPPGMDSDAHVGDPGPVCRFAEGTLDPGATQGGGSGRPLGVIPPGGGKEPGLVPMSLPGGAEQREGLGRQRDIPLFGALAAVDMARKALTIEGRDWQAEGVMEPEAQARDGGGIDLSVKGRGRLEEPPDLLHTQHGGETVGGLRAHERQRGPGTLQDVLIEEAAAAVAAAHGRGGEAIDVLPVEEGVLKFLVRDAIGGFVGELGQQADFSARGCLSPCALATELESRQHLLTQWGHARSPFVW